MQTQGKEGKAAAANNLKVNERNAISCFGTNPFVLMIKVSDPLIYIIYRVGTHTHTVFHVHYMHG